MKKTLIVRLFAIGLALSLLLSACAPAATPAAPAATNTSAPAAPQPTDTTAPAQPTATTAAAQPTATTAAAAPTVTEAAAAPAGKQITFGYILVGPHDDKGWSQATYEGGQYVESKLPGSKMLYIDNAFSQQGSTPAQLGEKLVAQGANVVIFNSDAFMDDSNTFAAAHPEVVTFMLSGDQNWTDGKNYKNISNMINIMGKMEYMKEVAGCTAALTTQTGKIGFLGPLINDETRRLADSAYLGAKYCWTKVLNKDVKDLTFEVTWIGNWFNIPGQTLDPTQVADQFFNSGHDIVISGIDTTEALVEAKKLSDAGKKVYAIPYDFHGACDQAPSVCLGVPYFNWGPTLLKNMQDISAGTWKPHFEWNGPDWANFNDTDKGGMVGFNYGPALSPENKTSLEKFVTDLGGGLNLWTGPMKLQDGSDYLKDGQVATDQEVWYAPQLLEGMLGKSK
jgi:simple sugar transport system substrate-binding protein